ncbi:MAG: hypothetical protein J7M40_16580 [Planctomycetes bacterium]|nr:hypothetical protein [Planctomycetota bacterium]
MSLVRWMRKNNRKIMAFVVVMIMLGFVGGYGLQQYLSRVGSGRGTVRAYYLDDMKIKAADRFQADNELKVLRSLLAGEMLRYRQTMFGTPDFKSRLLGEILFPDSQSAAAASVEMYQAMARGTLDADIADIDAFFKRTSGASDIYWILLKAEAKRAGCVVSRAQARTALTRLIQQVSEGRGSVAMLLRNVISNYRITEDEILRIFSDLLAVMVYSDIVTSSEAVTTDELRATIGRGGEKLNTEFLQFKATDFLEEQTDPNQEPMIAQFEAYKTYDAGRQSDENPYGFGYKLPDRVQLEYIIVRMADIEKLIAQPTPDDMEKYYTNNIDRFKEEVQLDPNDPESRTERIKNYADVTGEVRRSLTEERKERLANLIINDALELADAGFGGMERDKATGKDFEAAAAAYDKIAAQLADKHGIMAYTGKTGMLSQADLSDDSNLGMLSIEGQSQIPVGLGKLVFAIDQLGATEMGRFEAPAPRMWENIGPLRGAYGGILAVVRVIGAAKAEVPADINVSYSTKHSVVDEPDKPEDAAEEVHSVSEKVAEDCKLLAAMTMAKAGADEFVKLLADKTWPEAVDKYNKTHEKKDETGNLIPRSRLVSRKLTNRVRMGQQDLAKNVERFADNPYINVEDIIESKKLNDKLYELLDDDKTEAADINAVLELDFNASYYVVKDISRTEVTRDQYLKNKAMTAFQLNAGISNSLGLIHFNPDNIFGRMNFRWAQSDDEEKQKAQDKAEDKQNEDPA